MEIVPADFLYKDIDLKAFLAICLGRLWVF